SADVQCFGRIDDRPFDAVALVDHLVDLTLQVLRGLVRQLTRVARGPFPQCGTLTRRTVPDTTHRIPHLPVPAACVLDRRGVGTHPIVELVGSGHAVPQHLFGFHTHPRSPRSCSTTSRCSDSTVAKLALVVRLASAARCHFPPSSSSRPCNSRIFAEYAPAKPDSSPSIEKLSPDKATCGAIWLLPVARTSSPSGSSARANSS